MSTLSHALVLHKRIAFPGSSVLVYTPGAGYPASAPGERLRVKELRPEGALLTIGGADHVVPYHALGLCVQPTDRLDCYGYPLNEGEEVVITCHGGKVAQVDVRAVGVIEKFNKETARVRFTSDYEKVKNIPFSYLMLKDPKIK